MEDDTETKIRGIEKMTEAILKQQDINAGPGRRIVDAPVTITVYLKNCVPLSLVDLPGLIINV